MTGAGSWRLLASSTHAVPVPTITVPARTAPVPSADVYWS